MTQAGIARQPLATWRPVVSRNATARMPRMKMPGVWSAQPGNDLKPTNMIHDLNRFDQIDTDVPEYSLDDNGHIIAGANGRAAADLNGRAAMLAADSPPLSPVTGKPIDFGMRTMAELMAEDYTPTFYIDNLLAKDVNGILSGMFKTQKSHIALAMAMSVSMGIPFLKRPEFSVPQVRRVGYFQAEGGHATLQLYLKGLANFYGVDIAKNQNLVVFNDVPRIDHTWDRDAILWRIERSKLDLLFFDPMYVMLGTAADDMANLVAIGSKLRLLDEISRETGVTCKLAHHNRKTLPVGPIPDLRDTSGAGVSEWAGQWILLGHRVPFNAERKETKLWLNAGGRTGHGGTWGIDIRESFQPASWEADVLAASDVNRVSSDEKEARKVAVKDATIDQMALKIVAVLSGVERHEMSLNSLAIRCGSQSKRSTFIEAIHKLAETDGKLRRVGVKGDNNRAAEGVQLVSEELF